MQRPASGEFAPYYQRYIDRVPDGDIVSILETQFKDTRSFFEKLSEAQGNYRYAPDKWSIKEVLIHLIDAERIFAYRALRISRGDQTPLHAFDENAYIEALDVSDRTIADLLEEWTSVRQSNVLLLRHLSPKQWLMTGTASNFPVSVRASAWIIAGHELHHRSVVAERYL